MNDYKEINKLNWNERVEHHKIAKSYDLEGFKRGGLSFQSNEHNELGDVKGKTLVHLQCHFGLDTMSFTRLGANATGVDFSETAIDLAKSLAKELNLDTKFIESDVYELQRMEELKHKFDIVFTSVGALPWLHNLKSWAKTINFLLKPGGIFFIKDSHPLSDIFDEDAEGNLVITYDYFNQGTPLKFEEEFTYSHDDKSKTLTNKTHFEWPHSISEIIQSQLDCNLVLIDIKESNKSFYQRFPSMKKQDGFWELPNEIKNKIPLTISLKFQKFKV